jgi:hypothetical protein
MREELGNPSNLATPKCEVVAYNFPSWHPSPFMEKLFGKGWTEFETLKASRSLFPGHLMPKYPLWGYFNEADPVWAEKEIDAASSHGIDAWMIDWYWHNGTMFYHEQLEQGMLRASNRSKLKFAVMWANHDWKNVYPATSPQDAAVLVPQEHSLQDTERAIDYCIEHYFSAPNYWRIGGKPVFAIFDLSLMIKFLSRDGVKRAFERMRERADKAGLGGLHIQSSHGHGAVAAELKDLGVDSATAYHTFGWTYGGRPAGTRSPYGDGAVATIRQWRQMREKCSVPYFPDCPVGWDDSPRFGVGAHVVSERSPDQFERLMRAGRHFASSVNPHVVFLSAWNEWTEDHFLLPDTVYGYSYLEAVKRAFS